MDLLLVGQVDVGVREVLVEEFPDVLHCEALVMRDCDVSDVLALDVYIKEKRSDLLIAHLHFFLPDMMSLRK